MFDVKEILTAGMVLFAVIDIIGSTPIIIGLRQKVGHIQSEKASLVAMIIMIGFLFVGEEILNLIGIDVNSFAVAGSIVIFFLALEMILGIQLYKEESPETASIVPIAFPLIAGAGTLTSLLALRAEFDCGQYHCCHCYQYPCRVCGAQIVQTHRTLFGKLWHQCDPQGLWGHSARHCRQTFCQ